LATNASRGDQILNARSFEKQGFCKVLLQEHLTSKTLVEHIQIVYEQRNNYKEAMEKSPLANGTQIISELIQNFTI